MLGDSPYTVTLEDDEDVQEPKYVTTLTPEDAEQERKSNERYASCYIESIDEVGLVKIALSEAVVTRSLNVTNESINVTYFQHDSSL